MKAFLSIFTILSLTLTLGGCGGNGGDGGLDIAGSYTDEWGTSHVVSDGLWNMAGSLFHVSQYDNGDRYLVAQNDPGNDFNPSLWSRFDWSWQGADLYYCQSAYDAADEATALAASADPGDLVAGCAGFAWSQLTPVN